MKTYFISLILFFLLLLQEKTNAQIITTISNDFAGPACVCSDPLGNLYIADANAAAVFKLDTAGNITFFAGTMLWSYGGDGGLATQAYLNQPTWISRDASGNFYIADTGNDRIRKVTPSGIITTIAGNGTPGYSGDGGLAVNAQLNGAQSVCFDISGNVYIADTYNNVIRMIDTNGIITTIAGSGTPGFLGDGGLAVNAQLHNPCALSTDQMGNIYIADTYNNRVRKVDSSGVIITIAGNGFGGFLSDGVPAVTTSISSPYGVYFDNGGNIFIDDSGNNRIRRINTAGIITTIAGTGYAGNSGDGGLSYLAELYGPNGGFIDSTGTIYFADYFNGSIRKISSPTDIQENVSELQVSVFPNPSVDGVLTLSFNLQTNENVSVRVLTADGKQVYSNQVFCWANTQTELPVNLKTGTLESGMYFLEIVTTTGFNIQKIAIQMNN